MIMDWAQQMQAFMPHAVCLARQPALMALHIASDAAIAASYFTIPIAIGVFVRRRTDLEQSHRAIAILFAAFITLCGWTHVASIVVLWRPAYVYEGWLKAATALVSLATAGALPFLVPHLLRIPSPRVLQAEVEAHRRTLAELDEARAALAARVDRTESELKATTRRFEAALHQSVVTVYEQDSDLVYTWAYNTPMGLTPDDLVGRSEADVMDSDSARGLHAMKREALAAGEPRRGEFHIRVGDQAAWFDTRVEPTQLADGRSGLIATAANITASRQRAAHLQMLMREMNHRSKNILAMVMGITRQTAKSFAVPAGFEDTLAARLASLAGAHDVLALQEWRGADLGAVLESQLRLQLDAYGDRISIDGEPCDLPPGAAHYVGLALHELGSNAVKHGALSKPGGRVSIRWRSRIDGDRRTLELSWIEAGAGPATAPERVGFGMTLLKTLVARALRGEASLTFGSDGVEWRLTAPLAAEDAIAA